MEGISPDPSAQPGLDRALASAETSPPDSRSPAHPRFWKAAKGALPSGPAR